tara:strand:+ start:2242 stop:2421 length:180 start_codon:yes stop_codon:yes gene_type:complete
MQQPPLEEENERDAAVAQAKTTQGKKPGDAKFGQNALLMTNKAHTFALNLALEELKKHT